MNFSERIYLGLVLLFLFSSCKSLKTVDFENVIDTRNKPIIEQVKKTYHLPELGVYVSNNFSGARLSGVFTNGAKSLIADIQPENTPINNSAYYAFKVWADKQDTISVSLKYPKKYNHRYTPKIYRDKKWSVLPSQQISIVDSLSTMKIVVGKEPIIIAGQEIFDVNRVNKWTENLVRNRKDIVKVRSCGLSKGGRNMPVIDIYSGSPKNKPLVVFLTRQHPPEVTGFIAYQHFMEAMLDRNVDNKAFFEKYRVLSFPILNPDGVEEGHWRHNLGGVDLNRDWSVYNQKEVRNVVRFITDVVKKDKGRILLGMDFHSTYEDVFYTNNKRVGTTMPDFIDDWFGALERTIPDYKVNEAPGNSSKPVSKGWFLHGHNAVGITYEIGDKTPKNRIEIIGRTTCQEMIKLLNKR